MSTETKKTARIPIILESLSNKDQSKIHELLMDYDNDDDIYVHTYNPDTKKDVYTNITGTIKESVQEIKDGSAVIHICTEATLPPLSSRIKNHRYYVVTSTTEYEPGTNTSDVYVYYGVIDNSYYEDTSYLLIAQNMVKVVDNNSIVKIKVLDGYKACFYIPVNYKPTFTNEESVEVIPFTVQDRVYAKDPTTSEDVAYDVYISDETALGEIYINVEFTGTDWHTVTFKANVADITGLVFSETSVTVADGAIIGALNDPQWTEYRYIFKGWSSSKTDYVAFDPASSSNTITDDMTLYAYFTYDNDATKYTYECIYASDKETISTFYSVAAPNTVISPKAFTGYTAPTNTAKLTTDGQVISFLYTPISYTITYDLADDTTNPATLTTNVTSYTIEDEVTPGTPTRNGYTFNRWTPLKIHKGSTGNAKFTASWILNAILPTGINLRKAILALNTVIQANATTLSRNTTVPTDAEIASGYAVDVSTNGVPIYFWYDSTSNTINYYTSNNISAQTSLTAGSDTSPLGLFEGFTALYHISGLTDWALDPSTDITNIFKGCTPLSDATALDVWDLTGKNVSNAFTGTQALDSGRLPSWYSWNVTIKYMYGTTVLKTETAAVVPNYEFTATTEITGYTVPTSAFTATSNNQIFTVTCTKNS